MQQTNIPKPFPEPDESGNIFDPKYRIMHYSPYQRILEFKEDWTDGVPTFSSTTREPHVRKGKLFRHFMKNTSPLMNTEIRRILIEHRYSCRIPHKDTQQWFATPMEYLLEENSGASLDEIETMLRNHDYPADVGIHREYRKIVQRYMDIDRLTDDLDTLAYLIFQTANISRMLYFDTTDDEHRVSPLDVLDTMLNAMPELYFVTNILFINLVFFVQPGRSCTKGLLVRMHWMMLNLKEICSSFLAMERSSSSIIQRNHGVFTGWIGLNIRIIRLQA